MKQDTIETIIGFLVIITAVCFLTFAYQSSNKIPTAGTYKLQARFQNAEGISPGSDVILAGVKVGVVDELTLDPVSFFAITILRVNKNIKLPKDSQATITTLGLLGEKVISITPGADDEDFQENDQIKRTQSSINLESLIGKLMYSVGGK